MITEITRGHIRLLLGEKSAKIGCEMLVPTPGLSDFIIYADSLNRWEPPFDDQAIDEATKTRIFNEIEVRLKEMGRVVEFE